MSGALVLVAALLATLVPRAAAAAGPLPGQGSFLFGPGISAVLAHHGASLTLAPGAVQRAINLTITPLGSENVAPLDPGMTNVTRGPKAYRFGPHGMKFSARIIVSLPYDEAQIPEGLSDQDVSSFYFDEETGRWQALQRVSVDTAAKVVVSLTDHFTDMINATVTVPDHPEPLSFDPTSISGIKAADPGAGIDLIAPPEANNSGDARLSYPIRLPPGRKGVEPQLGLSYDSSAGNGWVGLGWDLQAPSIAIDTRWGVPHYDSAWETETYLLNGQQLTPVAHRGPLQARNKGQTESGADAARTFHTRVEGAFQKIERHGDRPSTYWWEVTDKTGTRFAYGGDLTSRSPDSTSVLANPDGDAIFRWMLREVRDPHGNTIRYRYDVVDEAGPGEPSRQIYLSSIRYTGTPATDGVYEVAFEREAGRPDVIVDARPGFKTVGADRLVRIDVRLDRAPADAANTANTKELIRRYRLSYGVGQFGKSQLSDVVVYGSDGSTEFNRHRFEYFGEVASDADTLQLFGSAPTIQGSTYNDDRLPSDVSRSTAIDATVGSGGQTQLSAGVTLFSLFSAGGKGGHGGYQSLTRLGLIDLDGDGLLDQLYESDGALSWGKNRGSPGGHPILSTGSALTDVPIIPAPAPAIEGYGHEGSSTWTFGGEAGFGVDGFSIKISGEHSSTSTSADVYLSDVNGDGLPDLVVAATGTIYYNRLENGAPSFTTDDPLRIPVGDVSNTSGMFEPPGDAITDLDGEFHLVDPIRRWVAPYDGTVVIAGEVKLMTPALAGNSLPDGIRAAVQHNGSELWSTIIGAHDTASRRIAAPSGDELRMVVHARDRIYFRLSSRNDPLFDQVSFNPSIKYVDVDPAKKDENAFPIFVYEAESDYGYGARAVQFNAPATGRARLRGQVSKSAKTSDAVSLVIRKNEQELLRRDFRWDEIETLDVDLSLETVARAVHKDGPPTGDVLQVRFETDSRIAIGTMRFKPVLEYLEVGGKPVPIRADRQSELSFDIPVSMEIYPRSVSTTPYEPFIAPRDGMIKVDWAVDRPADVDSQLDAILTLSAKSNRQLDAPLRSESRLLAKQRIEFRGGVATGASRLSAEFEVSQGDQVFLVADVKTGAEVNEVKLIFGDPTLAYTSGDTSPIVARHDVHLAIGDLEAFGGGFRGWSYGQYNGKNVEVAINESDLVLPPRSDLVLPPRSDLVLPPRDYSKEAAEVLDVFIQLVPNVHEERWVGTSEECWISATGGSASRRSANSFRAAAGVLDGFRGVIRLGGADSTAERLGLDSASVNDAWGDNWSEVDFMDFNGDRYPDVVSGFLVQPTLPNGALGGARFNLWPDTPNPDEELGFERVRVRQSRSNTRGVGAPLLNLSTARGRLTAASNTEPVLGVTIEAGKSTGTFEGMWDLIDMNGDGLPDHVTDLGTNGLSVRLNLGYRFGLPERWHASGSFRAERSELVTFGGGVGGGGNPGGGEVGVAVGGGISDTVSTTTAIRDLIDVNGDGLVDLVESGTTANNAAALTARYNTGRGFSESFVLAGALTSEVRSRGTFNRTIGGNVGISIPIIPLILSINIGGSHAQSFSFGSSELTLADINGDGYADQIRSGTTGNVDVRLNLHGKTNLLRSVERPLGGVINLDYATSGGTPELPGNRWVLSRVAVADGHSGDGVDTQLRSYRYGAGRFDRAEREFLGFGSVAVEDVDTANGGRIYRTTTLTFETGSFYTKGLVASQTVTRPRTQADPPGPPDVIYTKADNDYRLTAVAGADGVAGLEDLTAARFPELREASRSFFEGEQSARKTTSIAYTYDRFGNVRTLHDEGDEGTADDYRATFGYSWAVGPCQVAHIVGLPTSIVVTDAQNTTLRHREANVVCPSGEIDSVREYFDPTRYAETLLTYDTFGNLFKVTRPPNLHDVSADITYVYDGLTNSRVAQARDEFGSASTATYNEHFGSVETSTDTNGRRTSYRYDTFGRLESVVAPDQQTSSIPTVAFEYHADATTPWALTRHLDSFRDANDPIETVLLVDGLGRAIQLKKDATINAAGGPALDVRTVSGRVSWDAFGRAVDQRYPVTEPLTTGRGSFNNEVEQHSTTTSYDVLDRVVAVTLPDGTSTSTNYGFGPDRDGTLRLRTTTKDANDIVRSTYSDVRKLLAAVEELHTPLGQPTQHLWTTYSYDAVGSLVGISDAMSSPTTIRYDLLGRRTMIDNRDSGRVEFRYDGASNLIAKITPNLRAKGTEIGYDYDHERLIAIRYPDVPGNNVTYTYGAAGATDGRVGRIASVNDGSGSEERFYGSLGEVVKEVRTITTTTPQPETYTTSYVYDAFGRLQRLTYPDGEVLRYFYDSGGLVRRAVGNKGANEYEYLRRLEYDKFGQRALLEAGNGVKTAYTYDAKTRRLESLVSANPAGSSFQNLAYTYDWVGNVTSIANAVPAPRASQFGGPTKQTFKYDDLYRLESATGTYETAGTQRKYALNMTYDSIHNIRTKNQIDQTVQPSGTVLTERNTSYSWVYDYKGPQPHAATHVGDRSFQYDANGNQIGWSNDQNGTNRTVAWDEENRIRSVSDNGHEEVYRYDDSGERVMKRGPQGETVYVNPYFTVRNKSIATKHVFVGPTRLASKVVGNTQVEKDWYFYHADHLGSSNFMTDRTGTPYEHLAYFPFGETWIDESSATQRTPYMFTGKELDEETGLYYFGARYYDAKASSFLSADPLVVAKSHALVANPRLLSLRSYAANNPLRFVDPSGAEPEDTSPSELVCIAACMPTSPPQPSAPAPAPRSLAELALENPNIEYAKTHPSGVPDNANARQNIEDAAIGLQAQRSGYGNAPGGSTPLRESLLLGINGLAVEFDMGINELAGGSHSPNSRHYEGVAADVGTLNGQPVSAGHPDVARFMQRARDLGATEVLGPGHPGHDRHIHVAWPRPSLGH